MSTSHQDVSKPPVTPSDLAAKRAGRLRGLSHTHQNLLMRSWDGKSRKTAIRAFCMECSGWDAGVVLACASYACPLWEFRPYRAKKGKHNEPQ